MPQNVIAFSDSTGARKWLRFGRLNQREFGIIQTRVDRLVSAMLAGDPPDRETTVWLTGASDYVREKLAAAGLIEARKSFTLGDWLQDFIDKRSDVKDSTRLVYARCQSRLIEHFGESKSLRSITPGAAADWRRWMLTEMGENTVRKMTGVARLFFAAAVDHALIESNPFRGLAAAVGGSRERFRYVTAEEAQRVLSACPNAEWRCLFALARWGGLRVPSEPMALRWGDVDWESNRLTVRSPKTEHHEGRASRVIPIFPELRPHLEAAFDAATEGSEFVIVDNRLARDNLRSRFIGILKRAGLTPWPKLFTNLRSTRETELAERFPLQAVTEWIGNSRPVALKHYLQVTDEHFEQAIGSAPHSDERAPQKAQQHQPETAGTEGKPIRG